MSALFLIAGDLYAGEIYKWVDEKGRVHFTQRKPKGQEITEVEVKISQPEDSAVKTKQNKSRNSKTVIYRKSNPNTQASQSEAEIQCFYRGGRPRMCSHPKYAEKHCWLIYGLSCDRVHNWKKYGMRAVAETPIVAVITKNKPDTQVKEK